MAIHNTYDHALKVLARTYPEHFLALTLPNQPVQLVGTQENVELALAIEPLRFQAGSIFCTKLQSTMILPTCILTLN